MIKDFDVVELDDRALNALKRYECLER